MTTRPTPVVPLASAIIAWVIISWLSPLAAAEEQTHSEPAHLDASIASAEAVTVTAGHSSLLRFTDPIDRTSVNNPSIADVVVVSPTQLLVQGKLPGSTSLVVWRAGANQLFTVTVEADIQVLQQVLREVLPTEAIHVHSASGSIILSGTASSQTVSDEAVAVAKTYTEHVVNLLHVTQGRFEELLHTLVPDEQITVHESEHTIILAGKAKHPANVAKAVEAATGAAEHVVNIIDLPDYKQVLIQVRFAEVQRTVARALGVDYIIQSNDVTQSGFIGGALTPQVPATPQFMRVNTTPTDLLVSPTLKHLFEFRGNSTDFAVALNALEDQGLIRILAEPNLLAMSGEEASFLAGGEFPIPVVQSVTTGGSTVTVEFKEFGIRLNFKPDVTSDDSIRLRVEPEVSVLDFSDASVEVSGFKIPGLVTRRAKTTVQMHSGESLVIGGLLSQTDTKTDSKVPFLGNIPVLGKLFSSEKFKNAETELLVLVTPRLTSPSVIDVPQPYQDPKAVGQALGSHLTPPPYTETHGDALRQTLGAPAKETPGSVKGSSAPAGQTP